MEHKYEDEQSRLAAIALRESDADGAFVYAVTTTGVYCRPSCPARRAKREHTMFFLDPTSAEAAGFRPCKRCLPDAGGPMRRRVDGVTEVCRFLEESGEVPTLSELAARARLSPAHFHRTFKVVTGLTPKQFTDALRRRRMRTELERPGTVTDALYSAGYSSSSRFYESASQVLGMQPRQFSRGGAGTAIRYEVATCSLGFVLVAGTERGVCRISLGDDEHTLVAELKATFPQAELSGADARFRRWVSEAIRLVDAPASSYSLPLDVRGTAFQERVWRVLSLIKPGHTLTYTEVAERLQTPRSVRAVASACAANPVAVAIPCHRVVRADGSLAGYRWGVERKRVLLRREADSE